MKSYPHFLPPHHFVSLTNCCYTNAALKVPRWWRPCDRLQTDRSGAVTRGSARGAPRSRPETRRGAKKERVGCGRFLSSYLGKGVQDINNIPVFMGSSHVMSLPCPILPMVLWRVQDDRWSYSTSMTIFIAAVVQDRKGLGYFLTGWCCIAGWLEASRCSLEIRPPWWA